eukprot:scaffold12838_cov144-Isochrysis_galbana.AAC.4
MSLHAKPPSCSSTQRRARAPEHRAAYSVRQRYLWPLLDSNESHCGDLSCFMRHICIVLRRSVGRSHREKRYL